MRISLIIVIPLVNYVQVYVKIFMFTFSLLWLVFATSLAGQSNGQYVQKTCDDYMRNVGGPCLEGADSSYKGSLASSHRNIKGFILGIDSFEKAQAIFGKATTWHSGDAAGSESKVCYYSGENTSQDIIMFSADSEMSRGHVDQVRFIRGEVNFMKNCSTTSIKADQFNTKSGIHLGMALEDFKKFMGKPSGSKGNLLFYVYFEEKELQSGEPGYEACLSGEKSIASRGSGITAKFSNNKLRRIEFGVSADYSC